MLHLFLSRPNLNLNPYPNPNPADGAPTTQMLRLPLLSHKFLVPEPSISKDLFFSTWKSHTGPPNKLTDMVDRPAPASVEAVVALLRSLGFGVEHGYLDPNPHNEAGAAQFVYGPQQEQATALCQVSRAPFACLAGRPASVLYHVALCQVVAISGALALVPSMSVPTLCYRPCN